MLGHNVKYSWFEVNDINRAHPTNSTHTHSDTYAPADSPVVHGNSAPPSSNVGLKTSRDADCVNTSTVSIEIHYHIYIHYTV